MTCAGGFTDVAVWPPGAVKCVMGSSPSGRIRTETFPRDGVLEVEPERQLVTQACERFMQLRFEHELRDGDEGRLRITHRVRMTGVAAPLMKRTVGPRLERTIPAALAGLVQRATADQPTSEPKG